MIIQKTYNPTQEQLNATKTGINISLSANAGAGKTSVLVDRYIKLLENNVKISEIAAITFTKKAANEMIERIAERLDEYGVNDVKYRKLRKQLKKANISTIHSFCLNILQDYVIEAGLEPNFRELTDFEKYNIIKESIDTILENVINNNCDDFDNYYKNILLTFYKREEIIKILTNILKNPDLENILEEINNDNFENWNKKVYAIFYEQTKSIVQNFIEYINLAIGTFDNVKFKDNGLKKNALELINKLISYKENIIVENYDEIAKLILTICESTTNGIHGKGVRYFINTFFNQYFDKEELNASDYRKEIIDALGVTNNSKFSNIHFELNKIIFNIYKKVKREIISVKKILNGIDFDDILIKTRDLLVNNQNVAEAVANEFREIMIDEFQDTNKIQYDIIKALIPAIDINNSNLDNIYDKYTNIFIVGDVKQSIYRFRNADVNVFKEVIKDIEYSNKKHFINKTKPYNYGTLALTTTFRTLPVVTGFINKVCKDLELYEDKDTKINELVCGRKIDDEFQNVAENQKLGKKFGSINFLISIVDDTDDIEEEKKKEDVDNTEIESKLIAQKIIETINNNENNYKDFAILYKKRNHIYNLKNIFNDLNIPFIEQGSGGFWKLPEIIHILNYLNFLNNQNNNIFCAGVLISPFFSLKDTDLLNIKSNKNNKLWENIKKISKYNYITNILQEHIDLSTSVSITHLIHIILSNPNWIERLHLLKTDQSKALILNNIEKFINKAREFQSRGYLSLNDFLLEINTLKKIDAIDSDIFEETDINAVKLLTIHSSKGLEFKNVILYNLSGSNHNITLPLINKTIGIGMPIADINSWRKMEKSLADYVMLTQEKMEEHKEELRLLYVAMTRTKDNLYLSGIIKQKNNKISKKGEKSIFGKLLNSIGHNFESISKLCLTENYNEILINYPIKLLNKSSINANIPINLYSNYNTHKVTINKDITNYISNKILTNSYNNYKFIENNKILSFSKLFTLDNIDDYINSKFGIDFYNKYIDKESNKNNLSSIKKGMLYHKIMEKLKKWYVDENINENIINNIIYKELKLNVNNNYDFINEIVLNIKKLINSQLIQKYKSAILEAQFEYEIYLPFKDNYLFGIIDCLVKNENDEYEIWDWKTNKIKNISELKKKYEFQMLLYIYLLMHLYPKQNKYSARLISTELLKTNTTNQSDWIFTMNKTNADINNVKLKLEKIVANTLITVNNSNY